MTEYDKLNVFFLNVIFQLIPNFFRRK